MRCGATASSPAACWSCVAIRGLRVVGQLSRCPLLPLLNCAAAAPSPPSVLSPARVRVCAQWHRGEAAQLCHPQVRARAADQERQEDRSVCAHGRLPQLHRGERECFWWWWWWWWWWWDAAVGPRGGGGERVCAVHMHVARHSSRRCCAAKEPQTHTGSDGGGSISDGCGCSSEAVTGRLPAGCVWCSAHHAQASQRMRDWSCGVGSRWPFQQLARRSLLQLWAAPCACWDDPPAAHGGAAYSVRAPCVHGKGGGVGGCCLQQRPPPRLLPQQDGRDDAACPAAARHHTG
jgi:hypothetical protein